MNKNDLPDDIPSSPGVYIYRDENKIPIYVGKAKSLKSRISSYFREDSTLAPKTLAMRERAVSLEYILVDSPAEALLLECNLIKRYRPRYNILLKDDKTYPWLKLTLTEEYPRLLVTRRYLQDGSKYFGPYTNISAMNETLDFLKSAIPLRTCGFKMGRTKGRTCLNYDLNNCPGPCMGFITQEEYRQRVETIQQFLAGNDDSLLKSLTRKMEQASEDLRFEDAARYRDQLKAASTILDKQKVSLANSNDNRDFIATAIRDDTAVITVFSVRDGRLLGREHKTANGGTTEDIPAILRTFITDFYTGDRRIPLHIFMEELPEDNDLLQEIMARRRGGPVHFDIPQKGEKARMLALAKRNAELILEESFRNKNKDDKDIATALENLRAALKLPYTPRRIECYDISHIQGTNTVGSMITFINGKPKKDQYRRFKIKTVQGIDDFASLNEVLDRRYTRGIKERQEGKTTGFADFPDLFIIDGGKGQLSATLKIKEKYQSSIPFVSLAKREEELMLPGEKDSLLLPKGSPEFHLIQRIRDEAHRFAITFHRELRGKAQTHSVLEDIPGIGPTRKKALEKHFKTIHAIAGASVDELALVDGMNHPSAEAVYNFFRLLEEGEKNKT